MYEQKLWQDHVTEFEDRYTESRNDDGTITHTWKTVFPMQQKRRRLWRFLQSTTSRQ